MLALMAEREQLRTLLRAKIGNKIDIAKFLSIKKPPRISRQVEDIAGKNIIFLNTFLPLLTLREANLSFYLFVFSRVFARGPIYV